MEPGNDGLVTISNVRWENFLATAMISDVRVKRTKPFSPDGRDKFLLDLAALIIDKMHTFVPAPPPGPSAIAQLHDRRDRRLKIAVKTRDEVNRYFNHDPEGAIRAIWLFGSPLYCWRFEEDIRKATEYEGRDPDVVFTESEEINGPATLEFAYLSFEGQMRALEDFHKSREGDGETGDLFSVTYTTEANDPESNGDRFNVTVESEGTTALTFEMSVALKKPQPKTVFRLEAMCISDVAYQVLIKIRDGRLREADVPRHLESLGVPKCVYEMIVPRVRDPRIYAEDLVASYREMLGSRSSSD